MACRYDQSGALVPQLSAALMRRKIQNERDELLERSKFERLLKRETSRFGGDVEKATIKIQSRVRGRVARANVLGDVAYIAGGFVFATRQGLRSKISAAIT